MQRSGHAVKSETEKMVQIILKDASNTQNITFIPTHGNQAQMTNTAKVVKSCGGKFYFSQNLDVLQLSNDGHTSKVEETPSANWIGVCETSDNTSSKL